MLASTNKRPKASDGISGLSLFVLFAILLAITSPGFAQQPPVNEIALGDPDIYKNSLAALTILFVLAVLLESALAVIFNWRVFLAYFNLRGIKTVVMIVVSLVVVNALDIDVVSSMLAAYRSTTVESGAVSTLLTALILAGGSSGVNNILVALGYRDKSRASPKPSKAPPNQAWIAIHVTRQNAVGAIAVNVSPAAVTGAAVPAAIAGMIVDVRPSLKQLLMLAPDRFPPSGGYVVEPNKPYDVGLVAKDAAGTDISCPIDGTYTFSPGAIVDFEVVL